MKWNKQFIYPKTVRSSVDGVRTYDIGQEKSFDVDSELDFKIIEFLMSKKI